MARKKATRTGAKGAAKRTKLRVGIVGVGGMGSGHCESLRKVREIALTAVCDIDGDVAKAVAGARWLVHSDKDHGLAWGVIGYVDASRGRAARALAEIVQAGEFFKQKAPDDAAALFKEAQRSKQTPETEKIVAKLKA